jgi:hypothetical protein
MTTVLRDLSGDAPSAEITQVVRKQTAALTDFRDLRFARDGEIKSDNGVTIHFSTELAVCRNSEPQTTNEKTNYDEHHQSSSQN